MYPLKTKGEVAADVLKEGMPRAQRESGHKVKVIRTDNGGEFIGADSEAELKRKGIQHQLTLPYNPQQNGVAERFNRTLQEGLADMGLDQPEVNCVKGLALNAGGGFYSEEEISGVSEDGGDAEVEQQQQQQQDAPPRAPRPPERPRRDVRLPARLDCASRGTPSVVPAGRVTEQIDEDEISYCYGAVLRGFGA
ncbi:unnamed protein product [Closterium sp. NIES-53]